MPILEEKDRVKVREILTKGMESGVKLIVFSQEFECDFCKETRLLAEELAGLHPMLDVENYDLQRDSKVASEYEVEKIPAIVVTGDGGKGVRYFGIPSGYEFSGLLEDIIDVSRRSTRLTDEIADRVRKIDRDVHIQVFVTPTCPYCPRAVRTAHQMAMLNSRIKADMVESMEFPELANRYGVMAVPKIVINEKVSFEGALPDAQFLEEVLKAVA